MNEDEGWFFPELTPSYKVVLFMQLLACYILVVVIGSQFGLMWGAVAFAIDTLKDCLVVIGMVDSARAEKISAETARVRAARKAEFGAMEGRLLDRRDMDVPPAPVRSGDTATMSPEEYGR